jgi:hypothetical protein
MKKGTCPKCAGTDVWMTRQTGYDHNRLYTGFLSSVHIERFCCLGCGCIEEYIAAEDLQNQSKMERLRQKFTKV